MSISFYNMVREWTVHDYRTPGIKAEIILDMLLSPFVADIVRQKFAEKKKLHFLCKEFPIQPGKEIKQSKAEIAKSGIRHILAFEDKPKFYRPARVDYLLASEEGTLYLAELKTADESYDDIQLLRMLHARELSAENLLHFFKEAQERTKQDEKYRFQEDEICRHAGVENLDDFMNKGRYDQIKIVYLTLDGLSRPKPAICELTGNVPLKVELRSLDKNADKWKLNKLDTPPADIEITICNIIKDYQIPTDDESKENWALTRLILQECISTLTGNEICNFIAP